MSTTRVVALVRAWDPATEDLGAIRAQLRGLGAALVVKAERGTWSFGPDDEVERGAAEVRSGGDAILVIDDADVVRFEHRPEGPLEGSLAAALAAANEAMRAPRPLTFSRREWMTTCLVTGVAFAFLRGCKENDPPPPHRPAAQPASGQMKIELLVNGTKYPLEVEPRVSLLDALRERLGLTGTKKGCDMGQCGACTVHVGGKRVVSCLTLAVSAQGKPVTTIEGLAKGDELHPVQEAFVTHDALQCGFCTPGQIMSAVALLAEGHAKSDDEVRELMSGNICRCGAYPNIVAAIQASRKGARG